MPNRKTGVPGLRGKECRARAAEIARVGQMANDVAWRREGQRPVGGFPHDVLPLKIRGSPPDAEGAKVNQRHQSSRRARRSLSQRGYEVGREGGARIRPNALARFVTLVRAGQGPQKTELIE